MKDFLISLGIELTETQENQFKRYFELLVSENKKYNLTAIVDEEGVYYKHFYDSVTLLKSGVLKSNITLADIGSGAGFPAIPIKIVRPDINVTIIESQTKKANFMKLVINELNLEDIKVVNARAEDYANLHRNTFDIVTARAVAPLNILIELCIPFARIGGYFIPMKSTLLEKEIEAANRGIITLGSKIENVISFELPFNMGERNLVLIKKDKDVKGYPRAYAQIKKKPL